MHIPMAKRGPDQIVGRVSCRAVLAGFFFRSLVLFSCAGILRTESRSLGASYTHNSVSPVMWLEITGTMDPPPPQTSSISADDTHRDIPRHVLYQHRVR